MQFRKSLFWDTDPNKLDLQKHSKYIIERIMDFGNDNDVRWMRRYYPKSTLARVVKTSKVLQSNSKTLWTLLTQN